MKSISLKSYAKINIFLHILGKRQDGFHDIYTLFTKIGLFDMLHVSISDEQRITCTNKNIPTDEKNIISRVQSILKKDYGIKENFSIHIEKNIPDGGGLGGGSSNAAAYLKAVIYLLNLDMTIEEQTKIMASVGSDTAFFLHDEPMLGEGRGEILKPYGGLPHASVIILNPGTHISTAKVFSSPNLKLTDRAELNKIHHAKAFEDYEEIMYNGLEPAVLPEYPEVREAKDMLLSENADFAMMSGSGATVFGLYKDKEIAEQAFNRINSAKPSWKCVLTEIL